MYGQDDYSWQHDEQWSPEVPEEGESGRAASAVAKSQWYLSPTVTSPQRGFGKRVTHEGDLKVA